MKISLILIGCLCIAFTLTGCDFIESFINGESVEESGETQFDINLMYPMSLFTMPLVSG